jgi:hypothetical protein
MSEKYTPTPGSVHERKANWDHKYRHQNMSVDVDVWYPMLKNITFKTFFLPLKYREAEAILNFHYMRKRNEPIFTKEDTAVLRHLEQKVNRCFQEHEELKKGAMFRLSGRSGKDLDYYDNEKIMQDYLNNLEKVSKKLNKSKDDMNTKYVSIATLMNRFKVNNGKDVLNVLLTSERLFLDLKDWLSHGGREQMILREWEDTLCADKEFRGFVQNNELKAICQDERFALFQDLIDNKLLYEKLINDYFNTTVKPLMKIPNYVIDFCIIKNNEVKLIEFSPFLRCTSACLFRWDLNYDEMLHGTGKLKVREEESPSLASFVNDWLNYQSKESKHFDDDFIEDKGISKFLSYINPVNLYYKLTTTATDNNAKKFENRRIFVVSVLKNDFYWSKKYLSYQDNTNKILGKGLLENHCIRIDKNGFGWIMPKEGKKCYGEVWDVEYEDFLDVEFFYGQRDTTMQEITVKLNGEDIKVYAYILKELFDNVKNKDDIKEENCEVEEYTIEMQNEKFNPMQHVINQQERYLNMSLDFDLKDSW